MVSENPLISVIMPVRNNEKYFPLAVKSVLDQTYTNWELIIAEGLSTDNTADIADQFAKEDERIRVIHTGEWIYAKLNMGIRYSRGEYITFLNSDDSFLPETLSTAVDYINKYSVDLFLLAVKTVICDGEQNILVDDVEKSQERNPKEIVINDRKMLEKNWVNLLVSQLLHNQINVYKKSCIKDVRFRNDIYGADYYFNLEVLPKINSVAYYPKCLYRFNQYHEVDGMNTSIGKYYDYHHRMFNDFYYKAVELLANYNLLTDRALAALRLRRIGEFRYELAAYRYDNCKLSLEQKLQEIFEYAADVKYIFSRDGYYQELENFVLTAAREVINLHVGEDMGTMAAVAKGVLEIFDIEEHGAGDDSLGIVQSMVFDYYNPAHIGLTALNKMLST